MERTLDIFKNDAFSQARLRTVLPSMPFTPGAIGKMGLFTPRPIDTEFVIIYTENGFVRLIPVTDRAAPDIMAERTKGEFRVLRTRRHSKVDTVRASEMLGITDAAFPLSIRMVRGADLVARRMGQLRTDMAATKELGYLGALQGKWIDADGVTVIADFFAEFGVTIPVMVDVDFSALTEEEIAIFFMETFLMPMVRTLQTRNGGIQNANAVTVGALVGDLWWGRMMRHAGFREIWKAQQQGRAIAMAANPLATPPVWTEIEFGGVRWIHYMGAISGPLRIANDEARFFPLGAPDVFEEYLAPGETLSQVGELGRDEYPMIRVDPRDDPEFMGLYLRRYPLPACIYPKALMRARTTG